MENKKYEMGYDLHTHTIFSHGKGTIEQNVRAALDRGLTHIAITDHGPGHLFYGMKRKDVPTTIIWISNQKSFPNMIL